MSKTWKKVGCSSDYGRTHTPYAKRCASRAVRLADDVPNGKAYRKVFNSWDIFDFKMTRTTEEEAWLAVRPEQHWAYPLQQERWIRISRTVRLYQPRRYFSPAAGDWRYKMAVGQELPNGWSFDTVTGEFLEDRPSYDWTTGIKHRKTRHTVFWFKEIYVPTNEWRRIEPRVPDADFHRRFEQDTRNYRMKKRWGKTWRRDRRSLSRREVGNGVCSKHPKGDDEDYDREDIL